MKTTTFDEALNEAVISFEDGSCDELEGRSALHTLLNLEIDLRRARHRFYVKARQLEPLLGGETRLTDLEREEKEARIPF